MHDGVRSFIIFTDNDETRMLPCQIYGTVGLGVLVILTINTWQWKRLNFVSNNLGGFSAGGWYFMGKTCYSSTV